MHPDLERLVRLQQLDTSVEQARRTIEDLPSRLAGLDDRITARAAALEAARKRLADNQTTRRAIEKDLAVVQGRLSKFKDQLMEVKTNKEYHAMQKEIAVAEQEVRSFEDKILEGMLEADELTAAIKETERELTAEKAATATERAALEEERTVLARQLDESTRTREQIAGELDPRLLSLFDQVARGRRGVAVAEARGGLCTICHVRLRPQVFNEIRRNDSIIQCDSCQRILYHAPGSLQQS